MCLHSNFHFLSFPLLSGWGGLTLRSNCQIWREPQRSHQHERKCFKETKSMHWKGGKKLSFRLGQLLPCLTSPVGCNSWRLLFMYRQHTPTVTGQHPRVARHSPMKHLGSKWHQWELNISGTTQMKRSIQLQLPQESRNYCSKICQHIFFPIGLSPF